MATADTKTDTSRALPIAHAFAYYLPQYHVIPENEEWWGPGFTEWTKLRQAETHHPRQVIQTPGELGWYDLSDIGVMHTQYALARAHGIDTFALWHYWFGEGDLLLERPAEALLADTQATEFCFAWANHDWVKRATGETLRKQTYTPDAGPHYAYLEPFFHDPRYRKIDGKPVFILFSPGKHPHLEAYVTDMQRRAQASGFHGLYIVFDHTRQNDQRSALCDACLNSTQVLKFEGRLTRLRSKLVRHAPGSPEGPRISEYADCAAHMARIACSAPKEWPVILPGWDTSIRHGVNGHILIGNTPEIFGQGLDALRDKLASRDVDQRILIVKSWNEWAEGNLMEPSAEFGRAYLKEMASKFCIERDQISS